MLRLQRLVFEDSKERIDRGDLVIVIGSWCCVGGTPGKGVGIGRRILRNRILVWFDLPESNTSIDSLKVKCRINVPYGDKDREHQGYPKP